MAIVRTRERDTRVYAGLLISWGFGASLLVVLHSVLVGDATKSAGRYKVFSHIIIPFPDVEVNCTGSSKEKDIET